MVKERLGRVDHVTGKIMDRISYTTIAVWQTNYSDCTLMSDRTTPLSFYIFFLGWHPFLAKVCQSAVPIEMLSLRILKNKSQMQNRHDSFYAFDMSHSRAGPSALKI